MRARSVGWLPCPLLATAGCSSPSSPVPAAGEVAGVRLEVRQLPANAGAKGLCDVALAAAADVAEVIGWLNTIDWSQTGTDVKVVKVGPPDGTITLALKGGATDDFSFAWDGGFIHTRSNRLIRGGDMTKLRQIIDRVCK